MSTWMFNFRICHMVNTILVWVCLNWRTSVQYCKFEYLTRSVNLIFAMIRLFTTHVFCELRKQCLFVASGAVKRKDIRLLSPNNTSVFSFCPVAIRQHFSSECSTKEDSPHPKLEQPDVSENIHLDKWKSVMRSQATADKRQDNRDDEKAATLNEPGDDGDCSTVEATRDLVVMWRQAGRLVPEEITDEEVEMLAKLTTKSSKKKYLKYLAIREGHKKARKEKQQKKKATREALWEQMPQSGSSEDGEAEEHKFKNTFLLQFWDRSLDKLLAWRSAQSMIFGQPLVFDFSYEQDMNRREMENTVSQLMEVEGWNRRATEPFHLYFCNMQPDGAYMHELVKRYGGETWERLLITSTSQHHVDKFPSEQLVYLTADSRNVLRTFDHSKIYVVGALVDRCIHSGLSLANAKRLKIATARLPLDEYLHWDTGAKNLTLDQMIRILLTLKDTGNWEEALQFVPKRKHDGFSQLKSNQGVNNDARRDRVTHGQRETGEPSFRTAEQAEGGAIRRGDRTFSNSYKEATDVRGQNKDRMSGLVHDRKNTGVTRLQTSFKSKIEEIKATRSKNTWWKNE